MTESITKSLGSVLKWSGKYTFLFLVISLVLTATTITLADPNLNNYYIGDSETETLTFRVNDAKDMLFVVAADGGEALNIKIEKLSFREPGVNTTKDFSSATSEIAGSVEILSETTNAFSTVLDLQPGEYRLSVDTVGDEDTNAYIGYSNFNLGLIIASVIAWILFSLTISLFFTVLPFWAIFAIITAISGNEREIHERTYNESSRATPVTQEPKRSDQPRAEPHVQQPKSQTGAMEEKSSYSFLQGTSLEKLTKKDWGWIIFGAVLFLVYLADPFDNGFVLVISFLIFGSVAYNYFEREKTKDRISILLRSYPKSSIAFVAEQLDKKEEYIVEVLRIMILDEGMPIRLDLVNRSVFKIGVFPGEQAFGPRVDTQTREPQAAVADEETVEEVTPSQEPVQEPQEDAAQTVRGSQGEINEPWAYCQACGEALKKKVKYCYSCGARQYQ